MAADTATLLDILNKAAEWFKAKGVENHRLDAQLLLGHVLGMKRMDLYMNFDRPLSDDEIARFRGLIKRRGAREPLQHLLGETPFRELSLKVDRRALIPRQETELIIDLVRKSLAPGRQSRVIDVGVGAGPIFLSIGKEIPGAIAYGCDVSPEALSLTRENAARNGLSDANLFLGDLFSGVPAELRFDCIVSNPPYVGELEKPSLQPEVRDHDPALALFGGPEGWEFPARFIHESYEYLVEDGVLILEIGASQASILKEKSASRPWKSFQVSQDYQALDRFLILHK